MSKQVSSLGTKLPNFTHALTRRSCATPRGAASPSATGAISRSRYTCRRSRRSPPNVTSPPYREPKAECLTVSFLWTRELSPRRTQTYTQRDSNPNPNPNPIPGPYPHPRPPSNHNLTPTLTRRDGATRRTVEPHTGVRPPRRLRGVPAAGRERLPVTLVTAQSPPMAPTSALALASYTNSPDPKPSPEPSP